MKLALFIAVIFLMATTCMAEDGQLFVKNISKTPDLETDHATFKKMRTYVPAQDPEGNLVEIEYYDNEGALVNTMTEAHPLVAFYHDGEVFHPEDSGEFPGHGHRDVFGAVSMDDGQSWKRSNLSRSGYQSSFRLRDGTDYPGDTFRLFAGCSGTKVMVAWASRYARGGNPNYAMTEEERVALYNHSQNGDIATAMTLLSDPDGLVEDEFPNLYLTDFWGVGGSQNSSDFADEDFPTVGEVPYAALWTCRGTLEFVNGVDDTEGYEIAWRQAERITSARRDVHRIEVASVDGVGFVVTWQEDPDGLRPGHGEGPGEGWSGAVAHHETDIWYSYIQWDDFDLVDEDGVYGNPIPYADYLLEGTPPVGVPMSMPVRLTDNAMGQPVDTDVAYADDPYVYFDFDQNGVSDFCAESVNFVLERDIQGNPVVEIDVCVTEDGRLLRGNVAGTRNRVNLRGYDSDGDDINDSAWVVMAYEESKGLGEEIDLDPNELIEKVDMGKNIWYHTFNMFEPELVSQGLMLNQPAVYPADWSIVGDRLTEVTVTADGFGNSYDYKLMRIDPDPIYDDQAELGTSILFQHEISRRFSLISQPADKAGPSGTVAFAMWKQGIVRQGGPADVFARRFVLPDGFDPAVDNPFDYSNMVGDTWMFTPESDGIHNPRYVKGLCISPPLNMSSTTILECEDGSDCTLEYPFSEYFDDRDMSVDGAVVAKVHTWEQYGPDYGSTTALDPTENNLDDLSWESPYEVAKGHRGFISGDHIMMLYCWSANQLANSVGHDKYNMYVRRSFDGGVTWTTLPADYTHTYTHSEATVEANGSSFYENQGDVGAEEPILWEHAPGEFEHARNVSQLTGTKLTVLDPRFSGTGNPDVGGNIYDDAGGFAYDDDEWDPSKYFLTFEVGDNTTVAEGEATPLDMYYSRAYNFGDAYELCIDSDGDGEVDYFDWLENKKKIHAAEAAVMASPGGGFFYAIWNQWQEDNHENVFDSDAIVRRMMYLDEIEEEPPSGGGGGGSKNPPKKK